MSQYRCFVEAEAVGVSHMIGHFVFVLTEEELEELIAGIEADVAAILLILEKAEEDIASGLISLFGEEEDEAAP